MLFETIPLFDKQFKKLSKKYRLIKNDITLLINQFDLLHQQAIHINTNLYKIRISNSDKKSGKSNGYRIYYYLKTDEKVYFLTIYDKSKIKSIDEDILLEYIEEIENIQQ